MNGFSQPTSNKHKDRKRSYQASVLSLGAQGPPSELKRKFAKSADQINDLFAAALLAAQQEAKRHSSKVSVVDDIPGI